jgi:hypothetical protein
VEIGDWAFLLRYSPRLQPLVAYSERKNLIIVVVGIFFQLCICYGGHQVRIKLFCSKKANSAAFRDESEGGRLLPEK